MLKLNMYKSMECVGGWDLCLFSVGFISCHFLSVPLFLNFPFFFHSALCTCIFMCMCMGVCGLHKCCLSVSECMSLHIFRMVTDLDYLHTKIPSLDLSQLKV